jgi:hypothetical protein
MSRKNVLYKSHGAQPAFFVHIVPMAFFALSGFSDRDLFIGVCVRPEPTATG